MPTFVPSKTSSGPGGHFVPAQAQSAGGGTFVPSGGRARAKKKHRHGVLGFAENLGGDVSGAVTGIVPGVVALGEAQYHDIGTALHGGRPTRSRKLVTAIGKSYAKTYGPLAHGDLSKFLHNLYNHPLGPALDVATVLTAGAGAAAKAGGALAKVGAISEESRLAQLGRLERLTHEAPSGRKLEGKVLSRNPVIRARQKMIARALDKLPAQMPHVGSTARYANELLHAPRQKALARQLAQKDYNRAVRGLSNEQFAALHLILRGVHPADYRDFLLKQEGHVEPAMLKVLENPKVVGLVEHPDGKLLRAHVAAVSLGKIDTALKHEYGVLDEQTAANRLDLHRNAVADQLGHPARAMPLERGYVPDVPVVKRVANAGLEQRGGGIGVPRFRTHQNKLVLFRTGQLALHPDVLGPDYLRAVKLAHHTDIHDELMSSARRVNADQIREYGLPKDWQYIRKPVATKAGGVRPQRIHALTQASGDVKRNLQELVPEPQREGLPGELPDLTTATREEAQTLHGDYLIVPKALARHVAGEFTRSSGAVRLLLERPTKVWRALILGYRVGFLTNNVVGNNLMYALRFAGPSGLRAYLNAVKNTRGLAAVRRLIDDEATPAGLRQSFVEEFFPEQTQTFGRTQAARFRSPRARAVARVAGTGIMPATQAAAEGFLRRAATEAALRSTPEVRRVLRRMPRDTRYLEAAARKALTDNPALQREVSQRVNDALGDYTSLSAFERHGVRAAIPFYAWYRVITTVTLKLAVDTPGRADAMAKLAEIGNERARDELGPLPDFLQGLIPVGRSKGGKHHVLSTQGLNPFATVAQLQQGVGGALVGKPGATGKAIDQLGLNPFMLAIIQGLSGKDLFTGRDLKGPRGLPAQMGYQPFVQLPQMQLAQALRGHGRESKLYGRQTPREALLQQLGVPLKNLDLARSRYYASR